MRKTARYNIVFMMKPNDVITVFIQRMTFSMKETFLYVYQGKDFCKLAYICLFTIIIFILLQ